MRGTGWSVIGVVPDGVHRKPPKSRMLSAANCAAWMATTLARDGDIGTVVIRGVGLDFVTWCDYALTVSFSHRH